MRFINFLNESKYTIHFDMDGVLCNFLKSAIEITGIPMASFDDWGKIRKTAWLEISKEGSEFWENLEWMPGAKGLWAYMSKYKPNILSAHPVAPENKQSAITGKTKWVKKNLVNYGVVRIVKGVKKQDYASPTDILIDDFKRNIDQWEGKGGIGIWHTSVQSTLGKLKELGL